MTNPLFGRDILSVKQLSLDDIELILATTSTIKQKPQPDLLRGKIIANCFYEPSTRTRLSFAAAAHRLGANVIGFDDANTTSSGAKGESLADSVRINALYADAIVIRHPQEGAAKLAANIADKPVINAGDGANQHPTQTLLDLYSIRACQDKLHGLNIAIVGDLKYGRTVHSLVQACALYKMRFFFIAPEALMIPDQDCEYLRSCGLKYSFHHNIADVIDRVDIVYMTRMQKERFSGYAEKTLKTPYELSLPLLEKAKASMRILHPLPRVDELDRAIDDTPHAFYFQQAENGLYVRQALLSLLLSEEIA